VAYYVAERYVPASPAADVRGVVQSDRRAAAVATERIRHVRTWLLPADETCFSLFEAPSAELLRAAGDAIGLHYNRITEAVEGGSEDDDG
jgi:Protein of unknown function (DUF4242)